ncbi:PucR family transcriptional regulator [Levilactobacillus lanxiensis]|uniref:PucR family transcriptional regulator n=1 Tax=Levilactobacillus lanxiensis TaxID=2799568 RepID=A0ABW4D7P7_9LACO|nr:helix-turn-helix domain-containing protein [Levilactobacillus lanxiensis]
MRLDWLIRSLGFSPKSLKTSAVWRSEVVQICATHRPTYLALYSAQYPKIFLEQGPRLSLRIVKNRVNLSLPIAIDATLIAQINHILSTDYLALQLFSKIQADYGGKQDLQRVFNLTAQTISAPIVIVDSSKRIIARSSNSTSDSQINSLLTKEKILPTHSFPFIEQRGSENQRIVASFWLDDHWYGNIYAFLSNDNQLDLLLSCLLVAKLKDLNQELIPSLSNYQPIKTANILYSSDLENLFHGSPIAASKSKQIFQTLQPYQYIFSFKFNSSANNIFKQDLLQQLSLLSQHGYYMYDNGELILLLGFSQLLTTTPTIIQRIKELTDDRQMFTGISMPFEEEHSIKHAFQQSRIALNYATDSRLKTTTVAFQDIATHEFLSQAKEKFELSSYIQPEIMYLKELETQQEIPYYTTLRTYLYCNQNASLAAKHLNVHPNTLIYRIDKIKALIHEDFQTPERSLNYRLGFLLADTLTQNTQGIPNMHFDC